jgi:hypothetical protein
MDRHPNFIDEVRAGHYDLWGPHGIISPNDWRSTIKPDWPITMKIPPTAGAATIKPVDNVGSPRDVGLRTEPRENMQTINSEKQIVAPHTENPRTIAKGKGIMIQDPKSNENNGARDYEPQDVPQARFINVFDFLDEAEKQPESVDRVPSGIRPGDPHFNVFDFLVEDDQEKNTEIAGVSSANNTGALSQNESQTPRISRHESSSQSSPAPSTYSRQDSRTQDPAGPSRTFSRFRLISLISKARWRHKRLEKEVSVSTEDSEIVTRIPSTTAEAGSIFDTTSGSATSESATSESAIASQESRFVWTTAGGRKSDVPPIFTWQAATNHFNAQRNSVPRTQSMSFKQGTEHLTRDEGLFQTSGTAENETLRDILDDADEQIDYLLKKHPKEHYYFKRIKPRRRIDIEAIVTRTDIRMLPKSHNTGSTQGDRVWEKKKQVVGQAMKLLDSFVPPHQRSTLVDVFCGAMVEILEGDVSGKVPSHV